MCIKWFELVILMMPFRYVNMSSVHLTYVALPFFLNVLQDQTGQSICPQAGPNDAVLFKEVSVGNVVAIKSHAGGRES